MKNWIPRWSWSRPGGCAGYFLSFRGGLVELFALVVLRTLWKWNRDFSSIENKKVFWFYLRFRVHQSRFNFIKKPRATPNDADTFSRFDAFGGEITATLKIAVVFVINISESYGWQAYPITQPHKCSWIHVTSLTKNMVKSAPFLVLKVAGESRAVCQNGFSVAAVSDIGP